jgi:hypothetical protein
MRNQTHRRSGLLGLAVALLVSSTAYAKAKTPACFERVSSAADEDGCVEACKAKRSDERVSGFFTDRLHAIAQTGHHVEVGRDGSLISRKPLLWIVAFGLPESKRDAWRLNRRWAGPCSGLVALFTSTVKDDSDNAIDLYELRYATQEGARRVATLLGSSWDWNYHPFAAIHSDRSVIVIEGRHRDWDGVVKVAQHFGASLEQRLPLPALCDRDGSARPLYSTAESGILSLHLLGFSPSGRVAWLEERPQAAGSQWILQVQDLMTDRSLVHRAFTLPRRGPQDLCANYGEQLAAQLDEQGITPRSYLAFDEPSADADPTGLLLQPASAGGTQIVLQGRAGTKVLGTTNAPAEQVQALGFLRSPFESRVIAVVLAQRPGWLDVQVFGGRLDKGWQAAK